MGAVWGQMNQTNSWGDWTLGLCCDSCGFCCEIWGGCWICPGWR